MGQIWREAAVAMRAPLLLAAMSVATAQPPTFTSSQMGLQGHGVMDLQTVVGMFELSQGFDFSTDFGANPSTDLQISREEFQNFCDMMPTTWGICGQGPRWERRLLFGTTPDGNPCYATKAETCDAAFLSWDTNGNGRVGMLEVHRRHRLHRTSESAAIAAPTSTAPSPPPSGGRINVALPRAVGEPRGAHLLHAWGPPEKKLRGDAFCCCRRPMSRRSSRLS